MELIDLEETDVAKKREGGVDALVVESYLLINQICLEAGKELPEQQVESNVTLQVVSGEGVCLSSGKSVRLGPGKLLRIRLGASLKIRNESQERLVLLIIHTPHPHVLKKDSLEDRSAKGRFVSLVVFPGTKPGREGEFMEWFKRSCDLFSRYRGFISRTLLKPLKKADLAVALTEYESEESFMVMRMSDDRRQMFTKGSELLVAPYESHFYTVAASYRK